MATLMNKITPIFALLVLVFYTNNAFSIDVKTYEELKINSIDSLENYINGVGEGYQWSNSILQQRGQKEFYCPPQNIPLNVKNYMAIIDSKVSEMEKSKKIDVPVELFLFIGLVDSFPCSK